MKLCLGVQQLSPVVLDEHCLSDLSGQWVFKLLHHFHLKVNISPSMLLNLMLVHKAVLFFPYQLVHMLFSSGIQVPVALHIVNWIFTSLALDVIADIASMALPTPTTLWANWAISPQLQWGLVSLSSSLWFLSLIHI